mmetsp:Transcript_12424/g.19736  ORF Transcript_12424/g.19736 Transcript_12424/m.19736 type:complete len:203 (+) Transcript_12424:1327-1935(+)
MLAEVSELETRHSLDGSGCRSQAAGEKLEEGRLSSTVGAHDTHSGAGRDGAVSLLLEDHDVGARIFEGDFLHGDERNLILRGLGVYTLKRGGIREGEHVALGKLTGSIALHPITVHSDAASNGGGRVGVAVARDELLTLVVLLIVLASFLLFEHGEIHLVVDELKVLDEDHRVTDVLKQVAVVGDEHERSTVAAKTVLKPEH